MEPHYARIQAFKPHRDLSEGGILGTVGLLQIYAEDLPSLQLRFVKPAQ